MLSDGHLHYHGRWHANCSVHPSMSKTRKSTKGERLRRGAADRAVTTDVITQLECAVRHPEAAVTGAVIGGLVPWFARALAHGELPAAWSANERVLATIMVAVIAGCCAFSMLTIYKFGRAAFDDPHKALGFVLATEGVMLVSQGTTSVVALVVLIAINAIANGSVIALARDATCRRREADARRASTRQERKTRGERAVKDERVP